MNTTDVRESMRILPNFFQPTLTWITGKPLIGQKPLFKSTWITQTLSAFLSLFGGGFAGVWFFTRIITAHQWWMIPLVLVSWLFVAGAARKIQVTLMHQCSHFNYSKNKKLDRFLAQLMSTLIVVDHFDHYFYEHIRIHHTKHLSTSIDPDCKFLLELGFKPGMSVRNLWLKLFATVISPSFHLKFANARLKANFVEAPASRKLGAIVYHMLVWSFVIKTGIMIPFVLGWVLPLFPVYHVAALLNFSSLHFWLIPEVDGQTKKARMCSLTSGRFLGDAAPTEGVMNWTRWIARLVLLHLPSRIAVLSGDLPVHDYHHRYPHCLDWANFIYTRQRDLEKGSPGWDQPYTENWGLFNAVNAVYISLSQIPEIESTQPFEQQNYLVQI